MTDPVYMQALGADLGHVHQGVILIAGQTAVPAAASGQLQRLGRLTVMPGRLSDVLKDMAHAGDQAAVGQIGGQLVQLLRIGTPQRAKGDQHRRRLLEIDADAVVQHGVDPVHDELRGHLIAVEILGPHRHEKDVRIQAVAQPAQAAGYLLRSVRSEPAAEQVVHDGGEGAAVAGGVEMRFLHGQGQHLAHAQQRGMVGGRDGPVHLVHGEKGHHVPRYLDGAGQKAAGIARDLEVYGAVASAQPLKHLVVDDGVYAPVGQIARGILVADEAIGLLGDVVHGQVLVVHVGDPEGIAQQLGGCGDQPGDAAAVQQQVDELLCFELPFQAVEKAGLQEREQRKGVLSHVHREKVAVLGGEGAGHAGIPPADHGGMLAGQDALGVRDGFGLDQVEDLAGIDFLPVHEKLHPAQLLSRARKRAARKSPLLALGERLNQFADQHRGFPPKGRSNERQNLLRANFPL